MPIVEIRRTLCRFALLVVPVASGGCFAVQINAPYGPDVRVLPPDVPVEVTRRYQKWYAIWGIFPLSDNDPREIIARERLVEARVSTADSVEDILSGIAYTLLFPAGIIVPQTVVVEGNRVPLSERGLPEAEPERSRWDP
jgi:hypothetical protein